MLASVCRERITRSRSATANPIQKAVTRTMRVHCTLAVKSPTHRRMSATALPGRPTRSARMRIRASYDKRDLPVPISSLTVRSVATGGTAHYGSSQVLRRRD